MSLKDVEKFNKNSFYSKIFLRALLQKNIKVEDIHTFYIVLKAVTGQWIKKMKTQNNEWYEIEKCIQHKIFLIHKFLKDD